MCSYKYTDTHVYMSACVSVCVCIHWEEISVNLSAQVIELHFNHILIKPVYNESKL